jgi:hypothetical protein
MKLADALRLDVKDAESPVEAAYIALVKSCARLQRAAHYAAFPEVELEPRYRDSPEYLQNSLKEDAHEVIDYAYELLHAIKNQPANP